MILHHSNITTSNKCYKIICMIIVLYKIWGLNKIHWPIFTHKEILKYKFWKLIFVANLQNLIFLLPLYMVALFLIAQILSSPFGKYTNLTYFIASPSVYLLHLGSSSNIRINVPSIIFSMHCFTIKRNPKVWFLWIFKGEWSAKVRSFIHF